MFPSKSQFNSRITPQDLIPFILVAIPVLAFALWGLPRIPFHPDESTYLYMSSDFEILLTHPTSMIWRPEQGNEARQRYRLLDAPLVRYIIGLGRIIANMPTLPTDWNWSKTWQENMQAGALPDDDLLYAGRLAITVLLPFSLYCLYRIGQQISGTVTGSIAVLLLGFSALILLHGRRAMAEGVLNLGIVFALWSFLQADRRPWLAGLGMALAFNAKQSALALLPIGLIAIYWLQDRPKSTALKIMGNSIQYLGVFLIFTLLINPIYWSNPFQVIRASWAARQDLMQRQVADISRLAPDQVLANPGERLAVMLANLYLMPPSFSEAGNYQLQTGAAEKSYLETPGHNLMRNLWGGGLLLLLTLMGISMAILHIPTSPPKTRRALSLLLLATFAQVAIHILLFPLPWQRYVIPAVPIICFWEAYAVDNLVKIITSLRRTGSPRPA